MARASTFAARPARS